MGRKELSLNGNAWEVGKCPPGKPISAVERWIPAHVPGEVRLDLLRSGLIDDPFYAKQNESSRWVEDWDWWWQRAFTLPSGDFNRIFLRFDGIDYHSHIAVNGRHIAEHVGMFSPILEEITGIAGRSENSVAVCVEHASKYADRSQTLKCPMSYGWDFAPAVLTMGVWDDVTLLTCHTALIRNLWVDPLFDGTHWNACVTVRIDSNAELDSKLLIDIKGENFDIRTPVIHREDVHLRPGVTTHTISIPIKNPHLWYPWEQGPQNRYRIHAALRGRGRSLDSTDATFGLRHVDLRPNERENSRHNWTFTLNGRRTFIRGANWVPADAFPGRVGREQYESLLTHARDIGVNLLRVWGGGLREKKDFYDLCDRMGILVWQEFPFACPTKSYSRAPEFMNLVEQEARAVTRAVRNHPSVILLCGGNEFGYTWNKPLVHLLERIVREDGGGRPFKRTSPTEGEAHNWSAHHAMANVDVYRKEKTGFLSEFGLQAAPARDSLERFIPEENLWEIRPALPQAAAEFFPIRTESLDNISRFIPPTRVWRNADVWTYHCAQLVKLFRQAKVLKFHDLDSFIDASQRMQAHLLQIGIETMRRRRYAGSGVIFWQLNDPWPNISWSVLDYYHIPKLAYYKVREVYNPVLVSLDYPLASYAVGDTVTAVPHIINDLHKSVPAARLTLQMTDDGQSLGESIVLETPDVPADSAVALDPVSLRIPEAGRPMLICSLEGPDGLLSRNTYDLSIHDPWAGPVVFQKTFETIMKILWK